jgi:flagellar basal-body rod modification protein FlgD
MSDINSISSNLSSASSLASIGGNELGKDQFLQLLVLQLRHQDPLDPVKNEDFLAQLAQFSGLEQLQDINAGTQAGILMQQSITNSLAASLIGKDVLLDSSDAYVKDGEPVTFHYRLSDEAAVSARILGEDGAVVRTLSLTDEDGTYLSGGEHVLTWDGCDEAGAQVADGSYSIEWTATSPDGTAVAVESYLRDRVEGIRFSGGSAYLLLGGMEFSLADVVEIREASETDSPTG